MDLVTGESDFKNMLKLVNIEDMGFTAIVQLFTILIFYK